MVDREFQGTDPQSPNPKERIEAQGVTPIGTLRFRLRNPRSIAVSLGSASFLYERKEVSSKPQERQVDEAQPLIQIALIEGWILEGKPLGMP